jgi:hypothetical protein
MPLCCKSKKAVRDQIEKRCFSVLELHSAGSGLMPQSP